MSVRSLLAAAIGLTLPLAFLTAPPAAAASTVTIAMAPKGEYYNTASSLTYKATLSKAKKGTYAHLQRYDTVSGKGVWKTIKKVKISRTGSKVAVSFGKLPSYKGRWGFRVVSDGSSTLKKAYSPPTYVHRIGCDNTYRTAPKSDGTVTTAFSNPSASTTKTRRTTILALVATRTICSAANGATINVTLWDLSDDGLNSAHNGVVTPILAALDYMAKYRGVKVNFVFDGGTGMKSATKSWLTQIAQSRGGTYRTCPLACFSDRAWIPGKGTTGDAHQKFITISKTVKGTPATFVSTTNWSYWQLRDYWNNSVVLWGDAAAWGHVEKRFRAMTASASRPANTLWADVASPNNPDNFGMKKSDTYAQNYSYVLKGAQEVAGDPGNGLHISFSPQQRSGDTILDQLEKVKCEAGDSVKLTTLFADYSVGENLVDRIDELKDRGCANRIQMVISKPIGGVKTQESVYNGLRSELGSSLRCGNFVHTKSTLIDALDRTSSLPTQTAITGNRNFNQGGWYDSDETTLRFTAEPADSGAVKKKVGEIYEKYKSDFVTLYKASSVCPAVYDGTTKHPGYLEQVSK